MRKVGGLLKSAPLVTLLLVVWMVEGEEGGRREKEEKQEI